jgi:metal-responsive CopG/Arc/MetJ family transcriptional regulator
MRRVVINVPEDLLEALDKWRMESAAVISRSELFRKAVEKYLDDERKRELEEKSRRGYLQFPETEGELGWLMAAQATASDIEPWTSASDQ